MIFQDRKDAGQRLAKELLHLKNENPIIYALPRGGVPVAFEVAKELKAPLELLMVRKIGAPGHEEFGMGAIAVIDSQIQTVLNEDTIRLIHPTNEYIETTKRKQLAEIDRQRSVYLKNHHSISVEGRTAIVVDDGIATGGTAKVAIKALRQAKAGRVILAVPVSAHDTLDEFKAEGTEVVCLSDPINFSAVGLHYNSFDQTSDDQVIKCMEESYNWLNN